MIRMIMLFTPGTLFKVEKDSDLLNDRTDVLFVVSRCVDRDVTLLVISALIGLAHVSFWDVIRLELEGKIVVLLGENNELVSVQGPKEPEPTQHVED